MDIDLQELKDLLTDFSLYSGNLLCSMPALQARAESHAGHPIWTHQLIDATVMDPVKAIAKREFDENANRVLSELYKE